MPDTPLLDIPQEEQDQMRAALRRARYGYLLAWHVLLLCAAGRHPTEIAAFLCCSRSRVYRIVRLYRPQTRGCTVDAAGQRMAPARTTILLPWLKRSWGALLKAPPRASGWCRTRWRCATLAAQLQTKHGLEVSAWTVRRWRHEMGWGWQRAKLVAQENDPQRGERLARIRGHAEHVQAHERLVFAEALAIPLVPKVGAAWMPKGSQAAVRTPGQHEKHSLAGALHLATGKRRHGLGPRKNTAFFRDLLTLLDHTSPERGVKRSDVVVDNYRMHKAKAVEQWVAAHPRVVWLWVPTYGPRANPLEH